MGERESGLAREQEWGFEEIPFRRLATNGEESRDLRDHILPMVAGWGERRNDGIVQLKRKERKERNREGPQLTQSIDAKTLKQEVDLGIQLVKGKGKEKEVQGEWEPSLQPPLDFLRPNGDLWIQVGP
jgi:hypothetical protein